MSVKNKKSVHLNHTQMFSQSCACIHYLPTQLTFERMNKSAGIMLN